MPRGHLAIGASRAVGDYLLAPLLPDFLDRYPEVDVDLRLDNRRVDLLDEGLDLVVRVGELEDSRLFARRLASAALVPVAAPSLLAVSAAPIRPEELADRPCLVMTEAVALTHWRFQRNDDHRTVTVEPRFTANDFSVPCAWPARVLVSPCYRPISPVTMSRRAAFACCWRTGACRGWISTRSILTAAGRCRSYA